MCGAANANGEPFPANHIAAYRSIYR